MAVSALLPLPADLAFPRASFPTVWPRVETRFQAEVDKLVEGKKACVEARCSATHTAPKATRSIISVMMARMVSSKADLLNAKKKKKTNATETRRLEVRDAHNTRPQGGRGVSEITTRRLFELSTPSPEAPAQRERDDVSSKPKQSAWQLKK